MAKQLKKVLLITLSVVLVTLLFVGCGGSGGTGTDNGGSATGTDSTASSGGDTQAAAQAQYRMGMSVKSINNPFFREMAYGAKQAGDNFNVRVDVVGGQKDGDVSGQIDQCDTLLQSGIDALIYTPQNSVGTGTIIDSARSMNIPVITMNTIATDGTPNCAMYEDDIMIGNTLAENCVADLGGKGRVIILQGTAGASSSENTTKGMTDVFAKYPGIEVVASMNADYIQDKAQAVMTDLLQTNKNIDAVLSVNNMMIEGAVLALQENGYTFGEGGVRCYCRTIDSVVLQYIKDGEVAGAYHGWAAMQGYQAVVTAIRCIKGQLVPSDVLQVYPKCWWTKDNVADIEPVVLAAAAYDFSS